MTRGPVLNIADAPSFPNKPEGSERFGAVMAPMGKHIGARDMGVMYMQVEPGKRAYPFHNHLGNEEMFIILDGEGSYRFGAETYPIRAGDVCAAPKGGPETAHQIINTGDQMLKYLSLSTTRDPDICEYPDSGKFAAIALNGGSFSNAHLISLHRQEDGLDYYDGEEG